MPDKLNIEQLIKTRLGKAEIAPSPKAWTRIIRKVRRAQFFRFTSGRINIFYLSGLLITLGTAGIIAFLSNSDTIKNREHSTTDQRMVREIKSQKPVQDHVNEIEKQSSSVAIKTDRTSEETLHIQKQESEIQNPESSTRHIAPGIQHPEPGIQNPESEIPDAGSKNNKFTPPVTFFSTSAQSGCAPLEVELFNESLNATSLSWDFGDGKSLIQSLDNGQSENNISKILKNSYSYPGTYILSLTATGASGLSATHHVTIKVYPKPTADFDYQKIIGDETKVELLNYSIDASIYSWQILNPEPGTLNPEPFSTEFQPVLDQNVIEELSENRDQVSGKLRLIVMNSYGCSDTLIKSLPVIESNRTAELTFPNAFSPSPTGPNGGYYSVNEINNAIFHPKFTEEPAIYNLKIYSRTGELIFESNDLLIGWDGYRMDAQSAAGVYIWKASGKWKSGEPFEQSGDVTLIWKK